MLNPILHVIDMTKTHIKFRLLISVNELTQTGHQSNANSTTLMQPLWKNLQQRRVLVLNSCKINPNFTLKQRKII